MKRKFVRQNISRKKLKVKWRKPRGIHSKLRLNKAGHIKKPSPGFRSKRNDRMSITIIKNSNDLLNAKQSALISSKLGLKKKIDILKKAQEIKLKILNIKNIDEFIRKANENLENKKQEKNKKKIGKKKSKEASEKEAEEKKTDDDKIKQEKNDLQHKQDK